MLSSLLILLSRVILSFYWLLPQLIINRLLPQLIISSLTEWLLSYTICDLNIKKTNLPLMFVFDLAALIFAQYYFVEKSYFVDFEA